MIQKVSSLVGAEIVINLLMNDDRATEYDSHITTYQNCREQGFCINDHGKKMIKILICRQRNSDSLCIYPEADFDNIPTNKGVDNAKMFGYDSYSEAVDHIFTLLEGNRTAKKVEGVTE